MSILADEDVTHYHVEYSDFDSEDLDREQLAQFVVYHPLLDMAENLDVPPVGSFVWFAHNQEPRLGRVQAVDPSASRPLAVQVYVPHANSGQLSRTSFMSARDEETGNPVVMRLTLFQVRLRFEGLTARGYLSAKDRRRLERNLSS